jgi:hypothetical protein
MSATTLMHRLIRLSCLFLALRPVAPASTDIAFKSSARLLAIFDIRRSCDR